MKKVLGVYSAPRQHWVGDGFPVRSLFSYHSHAKQLSPFLLLDYAGPADFAPATRPRGVGQHPHRGFETVTIVYKGEVAHRDSTGQGGVIRPGDVQWMTAGAGILHEEFHSEAYTQQGGPLEMVQLWVNLPAQHKFTPPGYQALTAPQIPTVALPNGAGNVRIIAGQYGDVSGPAHTFTPMNVWDVSAKQGSYVTLPVPAGWIAALVVLHGNVVVNGNVPAAASQMVVMGRDGEDLVFSADSDVTVLLLAGEPIDEPVVGHGPFVMNTPDEIVQAINDFNSGRFGTMPF